MEKKDWAFKMAKKFSYKSSRKERFYIEANYVRDIERNYKRYEEILKELIDEFPNEKRAILGLARCMRLKGEKNSQIEYLEQAYRLDPLAETSVNEKVVNLLAYAYSDLKNFDKACRYLDEYCRMTPKVSNAFHSYGEIAFFKGDLDLAIKKFKKSVELGGFGNFALGYIYACQENYKKAFPYFNEVIAHDEAANSTFIRKSQIYIFLSVLNSLLGRYRQSDKDLQIVRDLYSEKKSSFLEFWIDFTEAWKYIIRGEFALAESAYRSTFKNMDPGDELSCYASLGFIFAKEGRMDSAACYFSKAKKYLNVHKPESWERYQFNLRYAEYLLETDSLAKSIEILKNNSCDLQLNLFPLLIGFHYNNPFYKDILARAYIKMGEQSKAVLEYQKLITFRGSEGNYSLINPVYHYRFVKLLEHTGNSIGAAREYQRFIELWQGADENIPILADAKSQIRYLNRKN